MPREFLLDTNAFFNLLKESRETERGSSVFASQMGILTGGSMFISNVTKIEIISVLGKYARGRSGGFHKCTRPLSETGHLCTNTWYVPPQAKWNRRKVNMWLQLINETLTGTSDLVTVVRILSFDEKTIQYAEQIIPNALIHNFASMDAIIAATAQEAIVNGKDLTVVTSDKGLKACLQKIGIPFWDAFG